VEYNSTDLVAGEKVRNLRWTASQQALCYRENRVQLGEQYEGSFIFLQRDWVVSSGLQPHSAGKVEKVSGGEDEVAWLKLVDPEEREGEKIKVYERVLGV